MSNLVCVLSKFSLYYGLPRKYSPNDLFSLGRFLILLVKVNNLTPMRKCHGGASRRRTVTFVSFFRPVNIHSRLKMG